MQPNRADAARSHASQPQGLRDGMLWASLGVALSPVIVDAVRLAVAQPWARASALMAVLAIGCMLRSGAPGVHRPRLGAAGVAAGVTAALLATGGGMTRLARPAIPLAALGAALLLGRPSPRATILLCFAVAPPRALMDVLPGLHAWAGPPELVASPDGGLPLAWLLAGLGAYAAVHRGAGWTAIASAAFRTALLAIPIQLAALGVAAWLWRSGQPDAAGAWLSHGVWTSTAAAALLWIHRPDRGGSSIQRE